MISQSLSTFLASLGSIIFVDLVLSGDNALVIGAALTGIPPHQRRFALIAGGAGAILARIVFTALATFFLRIHYLQAIGGVLVLFIACQLVLEEGEGNKEDAGLSVAKKAEEEGGTTKSFIKRVVLAANLSTLMSRISKRNTSSHRSRFIMTVITVVIADITMSLDNIVAIGALANGQVLILSIGLVISIVILLVSSAFVSLLIERLPSLILLAAFILAWIAGNLILGDVKNLLPDPNASMLYPTIIGYALTFSVVGIAILLHWSRRKHVQTTDSEEEETVNSAGNK